VRADGSQLAPSLVDIDNVNPSRETDRIAASRGAGPFKGGDKPTSRKGSGVQDEP